jgi:hypothetical protein
MKTRRIRAVLVIATAQLMVVAALRVASGSDEEQRGFRTIEPSLVAVWAFPKDHQPRSGTGFVVTSGPNESYVVTSAHVVADAVTVAVDVDVDGGRAKGVPAAIVDRTAGPTLTFPDLALLKVERGPMRPVKFFGPSAGVTRGKSVAAAGYFKTDEIMGYQAHLAGQGGISATAVDGRLLELNFALPQGVSGAPLFDPPSGAVIGMMESRDAATGVAYAVSASRVIEGFLKPHGIVVEQYDAQQASRATIAAVPSPAPPPETPAPSRFKYFRYVVSMYPCSTRYKSEIDGSARGTVLRMERNEAGRLVRVSTLRDGKVVSEVFNRYSADGQTLERAEYYSAGQLTGSMIQRKGRNGCADRLDYHAPDGALTSYTTLSYGSDNVDATDFSAAGNQRARRVRTFGADHVLVSERTYPLDQTKYYEAGFDHDTGLTISRQQFAHERLVTTSKLLYNADGDIVREDIFTVGGRWFGLFEYAERLLTRKFYQFSNDETRESKISYDDRRRPVRAEFLVNGNIVCTFKPDQTPAGQITRTIAVDRSGRLLAEYRDAWVTLIERDGHAIDGVQSIIYRPGNWW